MGDFAGLSCTKRECERHIVFIPKYRGKLVCGEWMKHPRRSSTT